MATKTKTPAKTRAAARKGRGRAKVILAIDVGGTNVKMLASDQTDHLAFPSGLTMSARRMVAGVKKTVAAAGWKYDVITLGYPGPVLHGHPAAEPHNLAGGWVGCDFGKAFGCPVRVINDATMQALGSYQGGKLLFLGLGTGLGSTMVVDGKLEPMELGHLPYRKGTYEDYIGLRGLKRLGKKRWRKHVDAIVGHFIAALEPDEVVLGGGNVKVLKSLPPRCRAGDNANAFRGGFRLWDEDGVESKRPVKHVAVHAPQPAKRAGGKDSELTRIFAKRAGQGGKG
jgi:polyphosphate glucokinase